MFRSHSPKTSALLFLASCAVFCFGAASIASATCEEGEAENVDLSLNAPTFKEKENLDVSAENTGNVEWEVKGQSLDHIKHTGAWGFKFEDCNPGVRDPKESCSRKLECIEAGTITWTIKVESTKGVTAEKTLTIKCD